MPDVGDLEDRRVGVLVDGDDEVRALHADQVLDRAGDADRDVELGRDDLARAADLILVRQPARVDDRARRAHLRAERLDERLQHRLEVLGLLQAPAAGDDDLGLGQVVTAGGRHADLDELRARVAADAVELRDRAGVAAGVGFAGSGLHRDDPRRAGEAHARVELGVEHAPHADQVRAVRLELDHVAGDRAVELRGERARDVPADRRVREQHQVGLLGVDRALDRAGPAVEVVVRERRVVREQHLAAALLGKVFGLRADAAADHERDDLAAQLARRSHELERGLAQRALLNLSDDQCLAHYKSPSSLTLPTNFCATSSFEPERISAPLPFGGV